MSDFKASLSLETRALSERPPVLEREAISFEMRIHFWSLVDALGAHPIGWA